MRLNRKYIITLLLAGLFLKPQVSHAQKSLTDTTKKVITLNSLVITATRTEKSIGDIPVPIQVISRKFIQQTGSQKLIDILQQQTGLILVDNPLGQVLQGYPNPFGSGIQLQGLDPSYTLILLDGEPLTGRNAGILNLGRVAVGDIKQIEIVKGPATSLYGSDALAGVINIITEKPTSGAWGLKIHQAINNTWGVTMNGVIQMKHAALQLFGNRYSSAGYDLDKDIYGKTADPFQDYSFGAKLLYDISKKTQLQSSFRFFTENQDNNYLIYPKNVQVDTVTGTTRETDWSFNNQLTFTASEKYKLFARLYITGYQDNANVYLLNDHSLYDNSFLHQFLITPEIQVEMGKKKNQKFIVGIGYNYETIDANRYASSHQLSTGYAYAQKEWVLANKLNITVGARLDKHNLYDAQFNPKLALSYKALKKLTFTGSIGSGYKTPDFRQQFLSFTNSLIGYTILGADELSNGLIKMQQNGMLNPASNISPYLNHPGLVPETSVGINLGLRYCVTPSLILTTNFFRNDIKNLIEYYQLSNVLKSNGSAIFSYQNVSKVFTRGFDLNAQYCVTKSFNVNAGYQYLEAKDKDVLAKIENGQMVKRDPDSYESSYLTTKDYGGLFNRSKHTANLQLMYHLAKADMDFSARIIYKSRFGFIGKKYVNGNGQSVIFQDGTDILDDDRKYADGYTTMNISVSKKFAHHIELQIGSDNVTNYTNKETLPNLFGRTYFVNCSIDLKQLLKK